MTATIAPELILRDPAPSLQSLRAMWHGRPERWVFGYASLIWRPEFDAAEHRSARVHGWHRALRMRSRVCLLYTSQVGLAGVGAAQDDALGDSLEGGFHGSGVVTSTPIIK